MCPDSGPHVRLDCLRLEQVIKKRVKDRQDAKGHS